MIKDDNEADGDPAGSDSGAGLSSSSHVESGGGGVGGGGRGGGHGSLRIKGEAVFVPRPSTATGSSTTKGGGYSAVPNAVMDVQEKGSKGFTVQTPGMVYYCHVDSVELRAKWMAAIHRVGL